MNLETKNLLLDRMDSLIDQLSAGFKWLKENYPEAAEALNQRLSQAVTENLHTPPRKRGKVVSEDGLRAKECIAHYCDEFKAKYGSHPKILGSAAGRIKTLVKDLGLAESKRLLTAYFQMHDQWFLTKRHDLNTFLGNINKVLVFADSGATITRKQTQTVESVDNNARVLDRWLQKGGPQ